eukprot:scaffold2957_cov234-Pinguiococcus_pyrenoidosus.AAC.1
MMYYILQRCCLLACSLYPRHCAAETLSSLCLDYERKCGPEHGPGDVPPCYLRGLAEVRVPRLHRMLGGRLLPDELSPALVANQREAIHVHKRFLLPLK